MSAELRCTCPSGDGSLVYPCPRHRDECTAGMSAQPVDVLAVLDTLRTECVRALILKDGDDYDHWREYVDSVIASHDAVAELIEAGRDVNAWLIRNGLGNTAHQQHLAEKLARCTGGQ